MNRSVSIWEIPLVGWGRKCPSCERTIVHKGFYSKYNATKSHKNSKLCFLCSNADKTEVNILKNDIWFENGSWYRKCPKCKSPIARKGKNSKCVAALAHRQKRNCHSCSNGRKHSELTLEKMRVSAALRIKTYGVHSRGFNPKACEFIEQWGNEHGYNFRHALNGGEHMIGGYFVDGYDKEKNVVFEYDEPIHESPSHKTKDIKRQKTIIDKINPSIFIRYTEKTNTLYDVIRGKELI